MPKLVAAGIVVAVDIVRRPDDDSPQGAAIVKKADEIDAATIVICPHEQDFKSEVTHSGSSPHVHSSMHCSCKHGHQPWGQRAASVGPKTAREARDVRLNVCSGKVWSSSHAQTCVHFCHPLDRRS